MERQIIKEFEQQQLHKKFVRKKFKKAIELLLIIIIFGGLIWLIK